MIINNFFKRHWRIIVIEIILLILIVALVGWFSRSNKIHVAVVFDQDIPVGGEVIQDALEIYADRINKYGGIKSKNSRINGKRLEFVFYPEEGVQEQGKEIAEQVVEHNEEKRFVAVIGHFNKTTTEAAASTYHEANIPLLVPWSNVDIDNQLVFQISPKPADYGLYTAHYIKQVLKKDRVTIIHSEEIDAIKISESFEENFVALSGKIKRKRFSENQIDNFVSELKEDGNNMLLLATPPKQTAQLVIALKEKEIDIPVMSMNSNIMEESKNKCNEEKGKKKECMEKYAVYYSDGIYAPSLLLFDNLKQELALVRKDYELKQEKENKKKIKEQDKIDDLTLDAMKAVLAAEFIVNGLRSSPSEQEEKFLTAAEEVLSYLKKSDWFNDDRKVKATKLIIGMFSQQHLIKAPINPIIVDPLDIPKKYRKGLLTLDERTLYPADVVYSGISMNKISNIDLDNLTYDLDFFVWFRYRHGVKHADDIEFLNSLQNSKLSDIVEETDRRKEKKEATPTPEGAMTASLVKKKEVCPENETERRKKEGEARQQDAMTASCEDAYPEKKFRWAYSLYRVTGRFKTYDAKNYALGQQNLYVMFRNSRSNKFKLNYVSDYLNSNKGLYYREDVEGAKFEELKFNLIDAPQLELKYSFSYISESKKTTQGLPELLNSSTDFSKFVAEYRVEPVLFSLRGMIYRLNGLFSKETGGNEDDVNIPLMILCFALCFALFRFAVYGSRTSPLDRYSTWWWGLKLSLILLMLLFGELVVSQLLYQLKNTEWGTFHRSAIATIMQYWGTGIAIGSLLVPAYYITSAFEQFVWHPIRQKTGAEPPNVLRLFVMVIIYTVAGFGILYYVFEVKSNSLVATSGAVAVLFAVASKIDLSNVLAGLGISFSKTFKLGDWVKIDDVEGKIVEMTPRSTKLLTFDSSLIDLPNSTVANAVIENFNRPELPYRLVIRMELVPAYRFERVEKLLVDAVMSTQGVLDTPKPVVIFKGQGDSCQVYEVAFFIDDYEKRVVLWQAAWRRIWRHLEQGGIEMATPQREVFLPKTPVKEISSSLTLINNYSVFAGLTDEAKVQLVEKSERQRCRTGEVILSLDDEQEKIFIITEGAVSLTDAGGQEKRLGVADVFGTDDSAEQITVTAITDSEVLAISKEDFRRATERGELI